MGEDSNNLPIPGVMPGTPLVTSPSPGVTPPKPPTTLEEALARNALLEHSLHNKTEENDRHSKKIQEHEAAQEKQKREAAKKLEDQQKEQGEWQKVAEQRDLRVKELEPVQDRYAQLSTLLAEQIKAQTKDWPKEVKDLLPGDNTPIEVRYDQVQKLQNLANQLTGQAQQTQRANLPGNIPGPRSLDQSGEIPREDQIRKFREERTRSGMYGL